MVYSLNSSFLDESIIDTFTWIKDNTPENSTMFASCNFHQIAYLYGFTNRTYITSPSAKVVPGEYREYLIKYKVYLVLTLKDTQKALEILENYSNVYIITAKKGYFSTYYDIEEQAVKPLDLDKLRKYYPAVYENEQYIVFRAELKNEK